MRPLTVALFGESEKGLYSVPYFCKSLAQLLENLGNPPPESSGLYFAIQALLYKRELVYFRVREEGFSIPDYLNGFKLLQQEAIFPYVGAIFVPGVGDSMIIDAAFDLSLNYQSIIVMSEGDLYDYLTSV